MPSLPTTPGNCIRCWSAAEKPATLFRATRFWRTSPLLPSDTLTFRAYIVFRWSAIWTAYCRQCFLERSPPARIELPTGNRYFWRVSVNTPNFSINEEEVHLLLRAGRQSVANLIRNEHQHVAAHSLAEGAR